MRGVEGEAVKINDGGPAFPADIQRRDQVTGEWGELPPQGMSKRELMAMHLMAALVSNSENIAPVEVYSKSAIQLADTLIAELAKEPTP